MKMLSEMSSKQAGVRVRTGLQGGRNVILGEKCYRAYDDEYFGINQDFLKMGRNHCCEKFFEQQGCLRDINKTAEEFFE